MANPKPLMAKSSGTDTADAAVQSALRTLDAEGSGIAAITAALQSDLRAPFTAAADLIRNAKGRLIVTGLGKSGHIGRKIAATFASTGTPAFFVHAAEASHGDLGMITAEDVILALSWSGEQPEMKNLISYAARFRISVIAMTSKGFGCVGIVDAHGYIVGIVTDGDLRRHMGPDLMTATVDEVMTRNPKTIDRHVLAGEALEILNSSKITTLIVTDAGKPVGIVHLHDFLRAGVA